MASRAASTGGRIHGDRPFPDGSPSPTALLAPSPALLPPAASSTARAMKRSRAPALWGRRRDGDE
jgi:hypothetical protein